MGLINVIAALSKLWNAGTLAAVAKTKALDGGKAILAGGAALAGGVLASKLSDSDSDKAKLAGYEKAMKALNIKDVNIKLLASGGNMVKFMSNNIIEPTIVVTKQCNARKDIDKVFESAVDSYLSFFLMVFKVLVSVYKLDSAQALTVLANKGFDHEDYTGSIDGLKTLDGVVSLPNVDAEAIGNVSVSKDENIVSKTILRTIELNMDTTTMEVVKEGAVKTSKEVDPITGDILLDGDGNEKNSKTITSQQTTKPVKSVTTIPVVVKASVYVVDFETIYNSVEHRGSAASFYTRFLKWKLDLITTKQLFTGSDLVEEYKKNILNKDNFATSINKKANLDINLSNVIEKRAGLNRMVVTYIMSDKELDQLCAKIGYDINKKSDKDKFMDTLLAFNVTAIDADRDYANVYISSITGFTPVPIKKLSKSYKDTDSIEMLAAAMMSNKMF